jgi:hypothetical protein
MEKTLWAWIVGSAGNGFRRIGNVAKAKASDFPPCNTDTHRGRTPLGNAVTAAKTVLPYLRIIRELNICPPLFASAVRHACDSRRSHRVVRGPELSAVTCRASPMELARDHGRRASHSAISRSPEHVCASYPFPPGSAPVAATGPSLPTQTGIARRLPDQKRAAGVSTPTLRAEEAERSLVGPPAPVSARPVRFRAKPCASTLRSSGTNARSRLDHENPSKTSPPTLRARGPRTPAGVSREIPSKISPPTRLTVPGTVSEPPTLGSPLASPSPIGIR